MPTTIHQVAKICLLLLILCLLPLGCCAPQSWEWTKEEEDALASRMTDCKISVLHISRNQNLHLAGHSGGFTYSVRSPGRLFFDAYPYLGHSISISPQHPLASQVLTISGRDLRLGVYALHLWSRQQPPCPWYDRNYWMGTTDALEYEVVLDGAPLHGYIPCRNINNWPKRSRHLIEHCKAMRTSPLLLTTQP